MEALYTAVAVLTIFITTVIVLCFKIACGSHGNKDRIGAVEEQVTRPEISTPRAESVSACVCGPPDPLLVNKWTQTITNEVVYRSFKDIKANAVRAKSVRDIKALRASVARTKTLKRQRSEAELDSPSQYVSLTPKLSATAKPFFPSGSTPEPNYATIKPLGATARTPRAVLGRSASFSEGSRSGAFVSNTFLRGKQVNHYSSIAENREKEEC